MLGKGNGVDDFDDGFGGEIDFGDFSQDNTGDSAFAEGNENDVAGEELLTERIGQGATAITVDFSWYYLEKHNIIIA